MADDERPIIIKKIKKGGHGHHGGAWKVAYADFVTAMMAFFLLLWLLSSTPQQKLQGIADYFTPTVGLKGEMGIGVEGGEAPDTEGRNEDTLSPAAIIYGAPPTGQIVKDPTDQMEMEKETQEFEKLKEKVEEMIQNDAQMKEFEENLLIEQTPEGLRIQIVDQDKRSMFKPGSAILEEFAKLILRKLAPIMSELPNRVSISGHTDAQSFRPGATYTNWELSADRANATRRYLRTTVLPKDKVVVVSGKADRELLVPNDPLSARNRRISLLLLYKHIYPYEVPATDELMQPPKPDAPAPDLRIPR